MVGASASRLVYLGVHFPSRVIPKDFKNGIHSFPAWKSAQKGPCGEQAGKFACCFLGQGNASIFMWQTGGGAKQSIRRGGPI